MAKTKSTRLLLWLAAIGVLILVAGSVAIALLLQDGAPSFDDEQWLHLRFSPMMADAPGNEGLLMDPADMPPLTSELSAAISHAATDESVPGLFIEMTPIGRVPRRSGTRSSSSPTLASPASSGVTSSPTRSTTWRRPATTSAWPRPGSRWSTACP